MQKRKARQRSKARRQACDVVIVYRNICKACHAGHNIWQTGKAGCYPHKILQICQRVMSGGTAATKKLSSRYSDVSAVRLKIGCGTRLSCCQGLSVSNSPNSSMHLAQFAAYFALRPASLTQLSCPAQPAKWRLLSVSVKTVNDVNCPISSGTTECYFR